MARREYLYLMPCCAHSGRIVMEGMALATTACERCGTPFTPMTVAYLTQRGTTRQRINDRYPAAEVPTVYDEAWEDATRIEHPEALEALCAAAGPRSGSRFRGD